MPHREDIEFHTRDGVEYATLPKADFDRLLDRLADSAPAAEPCKDDVTGSGERDASIPPD